MIRESKWNSSTPCSNWQLHQTLHIVSAWGISIQANFPCVFHFYNGSWRNIINASVARNNSEYILAILLLNASFATASIELLRPRSMTGGYVFKGVCLLTQGGGGTPSPSPSHNTSTGPMSFLGYSSDWSQVRMGVPQWLVPGQERGVPHDGGTWGTPQPGMEYSLG